MQISYAVGEILWAGLWCKYLIHISMREARRL